MVTRQEFIKAARDRVGDPCTSSGSHRLGVNCLGLLVSTARDFEEFGEIVKSVEKLATYRKPFEPRGMLFGFERSGFVEKVFYKDVEPGDILLFKVGGEPQHMALVTETKPTIILHASSPQKKVVEHLLPEGWRPVVVFRLRLWDE